MDRKSSCKTSLVCLVLTVGTLLLYAPVIRFDFVNYDDWAYILDNPNITGGFSWRGLAWCFQAGYAGNWHPLAWMSHMLDCQLYGLHAGGHHVTNVLFHTLNSVLLFLVLRRMTGTLWRAAMVAALFAWHPLHVESVAWVSERKDVLSTFFFMLTLWAYARYAENLKSQISNSKFHYIMALVFFALGLMAKSMLVTLPFVLLLLDWWPLQRVLTQGAADQENRGENSSAKPMTSLIVEKIPFFVLSGVSSVLTMVAQGRIGAIATMEQVPFTVRLLNALLAYFRYAKKTLWPNKLAIVYVFDRQWPVWVLLISFMFVIMLIVMGVRLRKTRPYWLVGGLWYLGTLVPVIGLVKMGDQAMADRYTYIPAIGLFVIICWEVCDMSRDWRKPELSLGILGVGALAACCILTARQLQYWRNSGELFAHAIAVTRNNHIAHASYASWLRNENRLAEARAECEKALQISPNYGYGQFVLANVLFTQGDFAEAEPHLRKALGVPGYQQETRVGLGRVLLAQNRPAEAAAEFAIALKQNPANAIAHCWMGAALAAQDQLQEALVHLLTALRLIPSYADGHCQLAIVLQKQRHTAEAISQYRAALSIRAESPDALNNLAWILATDAQPEYRNGTEAVRLAARACLLTHDKDPAMIGTLAAACAEAGRFDEAIATAEKAHDVALALGRKDVAARNLELQELYRSHRPYHEAP
jgi:tetratricopeptide (TPR) repeat protein